MHTRTIRQRFSVAFAYNVHFTEGLFRIENPLIAQIMDGDADPGARKAIAVIDDGVAHHHPDAPDQLAAYAGAYRDIIDLVGDPIVVPGGEAAKNDPQLIDRLHDAIERAGLCRHSYVLAIGGGSVLDLVGYAAATAHRGIRLIRVPTTVLAQNDSGVGVKNGVNAFRKKNFLGTFAPPYAVLNDVTFLETLDDRDWRAGISEAIKVALLKDADFFDALEADVDDLAPPRRDRAAMQELIYRCAQLHLEHIATSGDPFEMGTSRPLDFGHWSAHKLEQLTGYELRHGEAVAVGIALDCTYSYLAGMLCRSDWERILAVFEAAGFVLYVPELTSRIDEPEHPDSIFQGLEEFREHLGGELTIMLLEDIGRGVEVHSVSHGLYRQAVDLLRERAEAVAPTDETELYGYSEG